MDLRNRLPRLENSPRSGQGNLSDDPKQHGNRDGLSTIGSLQPTLGRCILSAEQLITQTKVRFTKTMNNSEHTLDCICAWCEVERQHAERLAHRVSNHLPGNACICGAYGESECGCVNVDWRSRREMAMQTALEYCISTLKSQHIAKPGIIEMIRQTEMIRDAGNYRGKI